MYGKAEGILLMAESVMNIVPIVFQRCLKKPAFGDYWAFLYESIGPRFRLASHSEAEDG